jgi:hypothetical protein
MVDKGFEYSSVSILALVPTFCFLLLNDHKEPGTAVIWWVVPFRKIKYQAQRPGSSSETEQAAAAPQ